jgi:hypothetical protein
MIMNKEVFQFKISTKKTRKKPSMYNEEMRSVPKEINPKFGYKRKPRFVNKDSDWE